MDTPELNEALRRYLALDAREQEWTARQYARAGKDLKAELRKVATRIRTEGPDANLVSQQARLEVLIRQTAEELRVLAGRVDARVTTAARLAAEDAIYGARGTVERAPTAVFAQVNEAAVLQASTATVDGTRLAGLLEARVPGFAVEVRTLVVQGIVQGKNPNAMAAAAEKAIGRQGWNARTIMRTEMSRAYNDAARLTYQQAGVKEYQWLSAGDARTCPACLALHGTRYSTDEPRPSHPNCRCTCVPVVDGLRPVPSGDEVLRKMNPADRLAALGPGRLEAWHAGVPLSEMVVVRQHPVWGPTVAQRPLRDL